MPRYVTSSAVSVFFFAYPRDIIYLLLPFRYTVCIKTITIYHLLLMEAGFFRACAVGLARCSRSSTCATPSAPKLGAPPLRDLEGSLNPRLGHRSPLRRRARARRRASWTPNAAVSSNRPVPWARDERAGGRNAFLYVCTALKTPNIVSKCCSAAPAGPQSRRKRHFAPKSPWSRKRRHISIQTVRNRNHQHSLRVVPASHRNF